MRAPDVTLIEIPDFSLVVLIGATGSGKSTFAARWFKPTEIASSDYARGLISDDENDQAVNADAFDLVRAVAEKRLKYRRLTVIDATNVRASERKQWIEIARRWHALPVAIVLDPGLDVCVARNKDRPNRDFSPAVPQRMISEIRKGMRGLQREGFRQTWSFSSVEGIAAVRVERRALWTDRREEHGPFDIIGDVHGCAAELEMLLERLGYKIFWDNGSGDRQARVAVARGAQARFCRRSRRSRPALSGCSSDSHGRSGMSASDSVVQGNHDNKLQRWLDGRNVKIGHGLRESDRSTRARGRHLQD